MLLIFVELDLLMNSRKAALLFLITQMNALIAMMFYFEFIEKGPRNSPRYVIIDDKFHLFKLLKVVLLDSNISLDV